MEEGGWGEGYEDIGTEVVLLLFGGFEDREFIETGNLWLVTLHECNRGLYK